MESAKQLFQVFTNKLLFTEWLLAINIAIGKKLLKYKAGMEVEEYVVTNKEIDMRTAPPAVKKNMIYDEGVLKMRWDLCSGCEFLTDSNRCEKCGCFMSVKHKLAQASCPIGKWDKYTEKANHGIAVTT